MYEPLLWFIGGFLLIGLLVKFSAHLFQISLFFLVASIAAGNENAMIISGMFCIVFGAITASQGVVNVWSR